ncbi:hypothetical protein N7532_001924 [Penicillium argentinense]|uniref:Uncharacterized protein n=1 Tax=Penicillium argentinense TaxID=1131581 RepID=A0A9W9KLQ7_9EURO|nr:uncharacterized protein N7532_001924 [Penicillium argentinense]KAJ5111389.1 hypothetical protein N7532_001924 [Penicillium argentinense]
MDPLLFQGDRDIDPEGLCPPPAWTMLNSDMYSNKVGAYIPKSLVSWEYVMWDAETLRKMRADRAVILAAGHGLQ